MIDEAPGRVSSPRPLGPLGRRLLIAFLAVALTSVAVLTAASLAGTAHGLTASTTAARADAADATAAAAAQSYQDAEGWPGADLSRAGAIATAAGARLVVRNDAGAVVAAPGHEGPEGSVGPAGSGRNAVIAPVVVDGVTVGTVRLGFGPDTADAAQSIAWRWIIAAAGGAIAVAVLAAWFVSWRITSPLVELTATVRAFAAGDRDARAGARSLTAPGELGELARSFNATADVVSASETARRRMAADVAHELRTPLAALQAGLEELRDGYVPADEERLSALHAQSVRLGRIVGDLSQLAAAETSGLTLQRRPADLSELAEDAVDAAAPALEAAGLSVSMMPGEQVLVDVDSDRVHQALANLLMNTVRHCRSGDEVTVRTARAGGFGLVTVADTGPGIAADDLPHVFDRMWHGDADSQTSGLGIGLAVVKAVATAHGGSVEVVSEPGEGTTFGMRLPLASPAG